MEEFDKDLKNKPVEIAAGIFWVGYEDDNAGLHCNPYLLVEGEEAVLIDGGSRDDFSRVMLKILRTGISPSKIGHLIYQHYDPDLCGSLPQLEAIINNENLRIISLEGNNIFIHYYSALTPKLDFRAFDNRFVFATGRTLEFYPTPFCTHKAALSPMILKQKRFSQVTFLEALTITGTCSFRLKNLVPTAGICQNVKPLARCVPERHEDFPPESDDFQFSITKCA